MKRKLLLLTIILISLPLMANAETYNYNICKTGCEYNDIETMFTDINSNVSKTDDVIINFNDNNTYEAEEQTRVRAPICNSLTINGNNAKIKNYLLSLYANNMEINNIEIGDIKDNNTMIPTYNSELLPQNVTNEVTMMFRGTFSINNSKISSIRSSSAIDGNTIYINNSTINIFRVPGKLNINNSDIFLISNFFPGDTISVIKNSKLYFLPNALSDLEDATLEIHNCQFKELNYLDANHVFDDAYNFANNTHYGIVDNANIQLNNNYGKIKTFIYFDEEKTLNVNDKFNFINLFQYLDNGDQLHFDVDNEENININGTTITALKPGKVIVEATSQLDNIIYTLNLNILAPEEGQLEKKDTTNTNFGNANFEADLIKAISLSQEEIDAQKQGKDINVYIDVKDNKEVVSQSELEQINKNTMSNEKIGSYLDINLYKQIEGSEEVAKIEQTNDKIRIFFKIPENLINSNPSIIRTFYILRLHDNNVTRLETSMEEGIISFETDKFSTYALTYIDTTNPKTKDNIVLYIIVNMFSIVCISTLFKKRLDE